MRKIVNATYMSLDGDITNMEAWHFDYFGDQATAAAQAQLDASDALIMGRATYDGFSEAWSGRAGADDFADRMNAIRKYVVSNTLTDPTWANTTVISGDEDAVVEAVKAVKAEDGKNILQYGFGDVTRLLVRHALLDELRLWLHPVFSGKATREELLYRDMPQARFDLVETDVHDTGLIMLTYRPAA